MRDKCPEHVRRRRGCPICERISAALVESALAAPIGSEAWQPMASAPRNATWVQVKMKTGETMEAHWASDLSGEDQPPFEGWFTHGGENYFRWIPDPIAWRAKPQNDPDQRPARRTT